MKYIVLFFMLVLSLYACSDSNGSSATQDDEYQRQLELYDAQAKKADEQQAEAERQLKKSAEQLERADAQAVRMEKLLDRWEEQADRYDAILGKWERQQSQ